MTQKCRMFRFVLNEPLEVFYAESDLCKGETLEDISLELVWEAFIESLKYDVPKMAHELFKLESDTMEETHDPGPVDKKE